MEKSFEYQAGIDIGYSQYRMIINNSFYEQPNVFLKTTRSPWKDYSESTAIIPSLLDNLVVTIDSPEVDAGVYFIGNMALKSHDVVRTMDVLRGKKHMEKAPLVNTLGFLAGKAVQDAYEEEKQIVKKISLKVDMATALPASEWNKETARMFRERFEKDSHRVTVHVRREHVNVEIKFTHVAVLAEGVPATFAIKRRVDHKPRKGSIFAEFASEYGLSNSDIDGSYFHDKYLLHNYIGEGFTGFVLTEGLRFFEEHVNGFNRGVGHTIIDSMDELEKTTPLELISRQEFSGFLIDNGKYTVRAKEALHIPIEELAFLNIQQISRHLRRIHKSKKKVDIVVVYGGGSIIMRETFNILEEPLRTLFHEKGIKLFYVPSDFATRLNVEGLAIFVQSPIFKKLKKRT